MYGIEGIKKALGAGVTVLNTAGKVYEDGKVDLSDLVFVPALIEPITTIITMDFEILKAEYADLDKEEVDELVVYFKETFDIPQENVEQWIEASIDAIKKIIDAIREAVTIQIKFFNAE